MNCLVNVREFGLKPAPKYAIRVFFSAPLIREMYNSILIKLEQFDNYFIKSIAHQTKLQRNRSREIRREWYITTVEYNTT